MEMWGQGFIEFVHSVGTGEFMEDGADAGAVVVIVLCISTADGVKGRAKFMPPVLLAANLMFARMMSAS